MLHLANYPLVLFVATFLVMWLGSVAGWWLRHLNPKAGDKRSPDFEIILGATFTLLALIIGFSVEMAASRYDQRKTFEEDEANAIGTEYVRVDVLSARDAEIVRTLLVAYLDQRILFYTADDDEKLSLVDQRTDTLQNALWTAVRVPAAAHPTPITSLVLSGMNDVLNSRGFTQAGYLNRIPTSTWWLMATVAVCCNVLFGYGATNTKAGRGLALVPPFIVAISFLLIGDIDSPRHGLIRVAPENLISLARSFGR